MSIEGPINCTCPGQFLECVYAGSNNGTFPGQCLEGLRLSVQGPIMALVQVNSWSFKEENICPPHFNKLVFSSSMTEYK